MPKDYELLNRVNEEEGPEIQKFLRRTLGDASESLIAKRTRPTIPRPDDTHSNAD
jgi:hypothetical protein